MDILKVARKYLTPENLNVTLMIHDKDKTVIPEKTFNGIVKEIASTLKNAHKVKVKASAKKAGTVKINGQVARKPSDSA